MSRASNSISITTGVMIVYVVMCLIEHVDHPKVELVSCADILAKAIDFLVNNQSLSAI